MLDEKGSVSEGDLAPSDTVTTIIVDCKEISDAYVVRDRYFLTSEPLFQGANAWIHPGATNTVYYRGIAVSKLEKPSLFTYNVQESISLTEDRTAKWMWELTHAMNLSVQYCRSADVIETALTAPQDAYEHQMNFNNGVTPGEEFFSVVEGLLNSPKRGLLNLSAFDQYQSARGIVEEMPSVKMNPEQKKMLKKAYRELQSLGHYGVQYTPLKVVESLGAGVLGKASKGTMFISLRAFQAGQRCVTGTLLEEFLHISMGFHDNTREFQNYLMDSLAGAAERLARKRS